jgi:hypothetical protein
MPRTESSDGSRFGCGKLSLALKLRHSFVSRTVHLSGVKFSKAFALRDGNGLRHVGLFIAIVVFGLLHTAHAAGDRSSLR